MTSAQSLPALPPGVLQAVRRPRCGGDRAGEGTRGSENEELPQVATDDAPLSPGAGGGTPRAVKNLNASPIQEPGCEIGKSPGALPGSLGHPRGRGPALRDTERPRTPPVAAPSDLCRAAPAPGRVCPPPNKTSDSSSTRCGQRNLARRMKAAWRRQRRGCSHRRSSSSRLEGGGAPSRRGFPDQPNPYFPTKPFAQILFIKHS